MPLTAYSISEQKELDVEQVLRALARRHGAQVFIDVGQLPDSWRAFLRSDLECPCCFVTGAEIVSEAISRESKKPIRQPCFRFALPGHHSQCDYASGDSNATPENLVNFGIAKSSLTRAVRELVCTGIQTSAFSQKSIRDMREWFFQRKLQASFRVELNPRIPGWLDKLWRASFSTLGHLPASVPLTAEIASMPGFDWTVESRRLLEERHQFVLRSIREKRLWMHNVAARIEALAHRFQGEMVFDPCVLEGEYDKCLGLAHFMSHNYAPFRSGAKRDSVATCVLALSALILFVNDWNLIRATAAFAAIAHSVGDADQSLGNVMGLNPFHDYEAWQKLKQLQDFGFDLPDEVDPSVELSKIEEELRARFNCRSARKYAGPVAS